MPRSSRGSAPRRPAAPARPAPQQPARQASTVARPTTQQQAQQAPPATQQKGGSGLFGQMASTAAGVAVGSTIGHALGGFFGGGGAQPAAEASSQQAVQDGQYATNTTYNPPKACEMQVGNFRTCMDENQGNLTICGWYLDQLKACQQAASQY